VSSRLLLLLQEVVALSPSLEGAVLDALAELAHECGVALLVFMLILVLLFLEGRGGGAGEGEIEISESEMGHSKRLRLRLELDMERGVDSGLEEKQEGWVEGRRRGRAGTFGLAALLVTACLG
jgi:hypothetical protein